MADTTTITLEQSTKDGLEDAKPADMAWDPFLQDLISDNGFTLDAATIDDIATETAVRTANEVENRLR